MINNVKGKNAGFSLVELLVVIAIMGLLMGGTLITYFTVSSNNVKKAGGYIDDALTECRNSAMSISAESWKVVITKETVEVIKTESGGNTIVRSGGELPKNVAVSVVKQDSVTSFGLFDEDTDYDSVVIEYKALSGEIRSVVAIKDDIEYEIYTEASTDTYCDFVCDYNNKTTYKLRLYYTTGKHVEP